MDSKKIILGTAAGVGAVAALPIMGAIGTVSLLGVAVGGTLGGLAGAVMSENDDARCAADFCDGMRIAHKDCIASLEKAGESCKEAKDGLEHPERYFVLREVKKSPSNPAG